MAEEIKSIFKSRNYWMAFVISFLTLLGYSLSSWLNAVSVGESMEYRESALSLSVGGIFFGGFMLLFPFCASVAHATSQVDELQSGMARWRVMRGSVARYVGVKAAASMLAAALATTSAFALHAAHYGYVLETGMMTLSGTGEELLSSKSIQEAYLGRGKKAKHA